MNVALVLVLDDGRQQELPLRKPAQVIGRSTDVAVRIPSSAVSRHHCEITVADGKVTVKDLGSSNGTYVNRKRVQQAAVNAGDLLAVGDKVFVVRIDGQPATIDAEEAFDEGYVAPAAQSGPAKPAAASAKPAKPAAPGKAPMKPIAADPDDSSVADFDFLDEDDDLKKQPKL
ncbi:MAG: FHA domain-containing protein [Phycisphaerae bacterium]|jgi:predicted component of type VI protein secretion system